MASCVSNTSLSSFSGSASKTRDSYNFCHLHAASSRLGILTYCGGPFKDSGYFGCRLRYSSLRVFNCPSNALGIIETISVARQPPDRTCLPSLIRALSERVRTNSVNCSDPLLKIPTTGTRAVWVYFLARTIRRLCADRGCKCLTPR